jgi:hypothetical protein
MYVDFSREFAYVAPPKTGSHTVRAVLAEHLGKKSLRIVPQGHPHRLVDAPGQFARFYWFMTIRNPFPRVVSWWRHVVHHAPAATSRDAVKHRYAALRDTTFVEACRIAKMSRSNFLVQFSIAEHYLGAGGSGKKHVADQIDRFVRVENLFEDLNAVLCDIGQPPLTQVPPRHFYNNIDDRPWWEHYTTEAEDIVRDIHAAEFRLFGNYYTPSLEDAITQFKAIRSTQIAEPVAPAVAVPDLVQKGLVSGDVC